LGGVRRINAFNRTCNHLHVRQPRQLAHSMPVRAEREYQMTVEETLRRKDKECGRIDKLLQDVFLARLEWEVAFEARLKEEVTSGQNPSMAKTKATTDAMRKFNNAVKRELQSLRNAIK